MKITNENEMVIIETDNRIDANSAPELVEAFNGLKFKQLTLDLQNTQYVSSAALRAFMIGKQKSNEQQAEFSLINIQPTVKEVLDLSGFSKVLNIN